ncbi:peptidoglycan recognition protein family protein [Phycisphaera mikurensis]|uniref:N-acetylmuramoyl-L-alanine amidase domain-containing protein n=1 Tax=Phycisphaera mikurensis (strain NBRC 102666 / KCTC 22515 / FYK2301M01) TaxID=1142394 RepID=I0IIP8_PHYMF|nr:peptidoglycan recognition family protein [Phycisphaera mikurensis]MBB6442712.1 hypothetical protein [Phycisphaera mikurensis]BAM05136.1 hypothetical protein PSMK_29770 [Phycisphaera mikurensis NBRC 102666]
MGIERRSLTIILSFAFGLSTLYGVLRVLEPGQRAPLGGSTLLSLDPEAVHSPLEQLFSTEAEARPWQVIVVHDSGSAAGSYDELDRRHASLGREGCGYHFVVNNGNGEADGRIQVGYRWRIQKEGDFLDGEAGRDFSRRFETIGICLIGNADDAPPTAAQQRELAWLIGKLQARFDIPTERVFLQAGSPDVAGHFPHAAFRERLQG